MTQLLNARLYGLVLLSLLAGLQGCADLKQDFYRMAMEFELSKAGLQEKNLEVNGKHIAYLENQASPDAPTILLLHGFAASKENWLRFSRYLHPDYHIVALDLPGHGNSIKDFNLSYDIDDQVGYVAEIAEALGLSQFHIVGNSMGGAISSMYAARYPEQVITVSLLDPAGIYDHESEFARRLEQGENPLIVESHDDFNALMDFAMEDKPFVPWPIASVIAEKSIANRSINKKIFSDLRDKEHDYDFKQEIQKITAPTFILWGEQDRVIAWQNAELFTSLIANSRKLILPDVGHAPMLEVPQKSAEVVKTFIETTRKTELARYAAATSASF